MRGERGGGSGEEAARCLGPRAAEHSMLPGHKNAHHAQHFIMPITSMLDMLGCRSVIICCRNLYFSVPGRVSLQQQEQQVGGGRMLLRAEANLDVSFSAPQPCYQLNAPSHTLSLSPPSLTPPLPPTPPPWISVFPSFPSLPPPPSHPAFVSFTQPAHPSSPPHGRRPAFSLSYVTHLGFSLPLFAPWMLNRSMTGGEVVFDGVPFDTVVTTSLLHQVVADAAVVGGETRRQLSE